MANLDAMLAASPPTKQSLDAMLDASPAGTTSTRPRFSQATMFDRTLPRLARAMRQMSAGVLEIPAMPLNLYGLADMGSQAIGGPALPGADAALENAASISEWATDVAGTTPADTSLDSLARLSLTAALPIPGGAAVAATAAKGGMAGRAALTAAEIALPFVAGKAGPARVAANYVVPMAANEAIMEGIDVPDEEYKTFYDMAKGTEPKEPQPSLDMMLGEAPTLDDALNDPVIPPSVHAANTGTTVADAWYDNTPMKVLAGAGLLFGGYRALKYFHPSTRGDVLPTHVKPDNSLLSPTTPGELAITQHIDASHLPKSQFERLTDPVIGKEFADRVNMGTRTGGLGSILHILKTGHFSGSDIRTSVPYRDLTRQVGLLDPARKQKLDMYLNARDMIEDPNTPIHLKNDARIRQAGKPLNDPELQRFVDEHRRLTTATIDYAVHMGAVGRTGRTNMLFNRPSYVPREGRQEPLGGLMDRMLHAFKDFGDNNVERIAAQHISQLMKRTGPHDPFTLNPWQSLEHYMIAMSSFAQRNKLRAEFVQAWENYNGPDQTLRKMMRELKNKTAAREVDQARLLEVRFGDTVRYFEVADPALKSTLDFAPTLATHTVPAALKHITQVTTTGLLAPLFAFKTFTWDTMLSAITRPTGRSLGLFGFRGDPTAILDTAFGIGQGVWGRVLDDASTRILTALSTPPSGRNLGGYFTAINPKLARRVADRMRDQYLHSAFSLAERFGAGNAGLYSSAYSGARSLVAPITPEMPRDEWMSRIASLPGIHGVLRSYIGLIDSIHNAPRLRFFARNYRPNMTDAEVARLVTHTRELTGDPSKRGAGALRSNLRQPTSTGEKIAGAFAGSKLLGHATSLMDDSIPYFNITKQAMHAFARAWTRAPGYMTAGLIGSVVIPMAAGPIIASQLDKNQPFIDEEGNVHSYSEWFWNQPAWWRSTHVYLPVPGLHPERGIAVWLAPELGAIGAIAQAGADETFGLSNGMINQDATADVVDALGNLFNFMVPPVVQAPMIALTGKKFELGYNALDGSMLGIRDVQTERLSGEDTYASSSSYLTANTEEVLTTLFGTTGAMGLSLLNTGNYASMSDLDMSEQIASQLAFEATSRLPVGNIIWGQQRAYLGTSKNQEYYQKVKLLDEMMQADNALRGTMQGNLSEPITAMGPPARTPTNPAFTPDVQAQVRTFWSNNKPIQEIMARRLDIERQIESLRGERTREGRTELNRWIIEKRKATDMLVDMIREFEADTGYDLMELDPFQ